MSIIGIDTAGLHMKASNEMDIDLEEQEINESFEKSRMLRIAGIKK